MPKSISGLIKSINATKVVKLTPHSHEGSSMKLISSQDFITVGTERTKFTLAEITRHDPELILGKRRLITPALSESRTDISKMIKNLFNTYQSRLVDLIPIETGAADHELIVSAQNVFLLLPAGSDKTSLDESIQRFIDDAIYARVANLKHKDLHSKLREKQPIKMNGESLHTVFVREGRCFLGLDNTDQPKEEKFRHICIHGGQAALLLPHSNVVHVLTPIVPVSALVPTL